MNSHLHNSLEYDSMCEDESSSKEDRDDFGENNGCFLDTEYDSMGDDLLSNHASDEDDPSVDSIDTEYSSEIEESNLNETSIHTAVETEIRSGPLHKRTASLISSVIILPTADHLKHHTILNDDDDDDDDDCKQKHHDETSDSDSKPAKRSFSSLVSIIQNQKPRKFLTNAPTVPILSTTTTAMAPAADFHFQALPSVSKASTQTLQQPGMHPFITTQGTSSDSNPYFPIVHMALFWEAMLSWHVLEDLNSYIQRSTRNRNSNSGSSIIHSQFSTKAKANSNSRNQSAIHHPDLQCPISSKNEIRVQPLPNQFDSAQQYKALWAPLHILEVQSQILSDIAMDAASAYTSGIMPVTISNMKMDHRVAHRIVLTLKSSSGASTNNRDSSSNRNDFSLNEWVILSCDSVALERAFRGTLEHSKLQVSQHSNTSISLSSMTNASPFVANRTAIVALVSERSRTLDGLKLVVLDHLVRSLSISTTTEFYLFRLGSNITAVREFNALSNFENLPLMKYILQNPVFSTSTANRDNYTLLQKGRHREESNPLAQGGKDGLGIGFRIYINSKFNQSQKEAIIAAATEYGRGGFTLVKGPPGTGKTTTLIAIINALHLRQYQRYYSDVENFTIMTDTIETTQTLENLMLSARLKPRILVCAPSNAAVDYVILKTMKERFIDGNGGKYNPSILRVGSGHSTSVSIVSLQNKVDSTLKECSNAVDLKISMDECQTEFSRIDKEIRHLQRRIRALIASCPHKLGKEWEARIDESTFNETGRVIFVNHKLKSVSLTCPPLPLNDEDSTFLVDMPHYRSCMDLLVKYVERRCNQCSKLDLLNHIENALENNLLQSPDFLQQLETKIIDSTDIIFTTLGSTGTRSMEYTRGFEVVVIDEAAQSSELSSLTALQLGSSHAILVGDPNQLPATIFSLTGRFTKFDRSLFQRLEESGHIVHLLNVQYRNHPNISSFPRRIFYDGSLLDGPNVIKPDYGGPLRTAIEMKFPKLQPLTIFDLKSTEERECTSLSNSEEAYLALHIFCSLNAATNGVLLEERFVCVITPYSQQVSLLNKIFKAKLGHHFSRGLVEISTIDAFQGNEREIVIFSAVRATNKGGGIGFLNDVRRMNVALTRAKHYLFVIARCDTILVNPYWRDFVSYAEEHQGVLAVQKLSKTNQGVQFPELNTLVPTNPTSRIQTDIVPRPTHSNKNNKKRKSKSILVNNNRGDISTASSIKPTDDAKNQVLATKFKKIYKKSDPVL